jgi:hypothetical protein
MINGSYLLEVINGSGLRDARLFVILSLGPGRNPMVGLLPILWPKTGPMGTKYREPIPSGVLFSLLFSSLPN